MKIGKTDDACMSQEYCSYSYLRHLKILVEKLDMNDGAELEVECD